MCFGASVIGILSLKTSQADRQKIITANSKDCPMLCVNFVVITLLDAIKLHVVHRKKMSLCISAD